MQKVWADMLSHVSIFLGLVYTLFPSKLDIWLQKNLKPMSSTREWSKSPWFSTTGKGKKMLCFCHWPLTCWLPYDYWWCSWQNGKKMLMLLKKMNKKGKKADREKKVATTRYQSQFLLLEISAIHCTTLANCL